MSARKSKNRITEYHLSNPIVNITVEDHITKVEILPIDDRKVSLKLTAEFRRIDDYIDVRYMIPTVPHTNRTLIHREETTTNEDAITLLKDRWLTAYKKHFDIKDM